MSDETEPAEAAERSLLLDELDERFESFQILRKSDSVEADKVLDDLGANDSVDREIVLELSAKRPLGHPDRFDSAFRLAVRALEVLDRNGARGVVVRGWGPFKPVGQYFVQLITRFLVRSYLASVIDSMRRLIIRREANSERDDPARIMLLRARLYIGHMHAGFKRNPLAVPTFLLGGAVLSSLVGSAQGALDLAGRSLITRLVTTAIVFGLFALISWSILRGAATARRRIRMTAERPIAALWETIGRCGKPPKDQSRQFATIAVILTALAWLIIPIGIAVSVLAG